VLLHYLAKQHPFAHWNAVLSHCQTCLIYSVSLIATDRSTHSAVWLANVTLSCWLLRGRNSSMQQLDCVERNDAPVYCLAERPLSPRVYWDRKISHNTVHWTSILQAWWTTSWHDGLLVYVVCLITCPFSDRTNSANFVKIAQGIRPFGPLLLRAKFHCYRCNNNGIGPQNWIFTEIWHGGVRSPTPRQMSPHRCNG